ncbi:MAG: YraN family protein [Patescibacteria group bacterium]
MSDRALTGKKGEAAAVEFLEKKGYKIICRNFKRFGGEIDLIAEVGQSLVLCEVKSKRHGSFFSPQENISNKKIEKMLKVLDRFLSEYPEFEKFNPQIDLVFVELNDSFPPIIEHFENIMIE